MKMKKAIILHGTVDDEEYFEMDFPSPSNAHWLPWLQQKFLRDGVLCQKLEMPTPYAPKYAEWKKTFEQLDMDDVSVIVGHSAGCGFILKWLSENENDISLKKLVLVAPWMDVNRENGDFLKFDLSKEIENHIGEIHVFYSDDDDCVGVVEAKDEIIGVFEHAQLHQFHDKGHFDFEAMGTVEFPELWNVCKL